MCVLSLARHLWLLSLASVLTACAGMGTDMDPPKVSLDSFRALPSEGGAPRFEIQLRVINPNRQDLDVAGISYSIEVMDRELLSGVSNEVPLIRGYTEEVVTLEAGLQLFQLARLLTSLGSHRGDTLPYRFSAKIDFHGFVPTQRIVDSGEIQL